MICPTCHRPTVRFVGNYQRFVPQFGMAFIPLYACDSCGYRFTPKGAPDIGGVPKLKETRRD